MINVTVRGRTLMAIPTTPVTSGSVGLQVHWTFSDEWDELVKIAVFRGSGATKDVALMSDACNVPAAVLAESGGPLDIGVYGADGNGTTVIPTAWGRIFKIEDGTTPAESSASDPEPNWAAQVQAAAQNALTKATAVETAANNGSLSPSISVTDIEGGYTLSITNVGSAVPVTRNVMNGKSAYEQAVEGGYEGTEAEFEEMLSMQSAATIDIWRLY